MEYWHLLSDFISYQDGIKTENFSNFKHIPIFPVVWRHLHYSSSLGEIWCQVIGTFIHVHIKRNKFVLIWLVLWLEDAAN